MDISIPINQDVVAGDVSHISSVRVHIRVIGIIRAAGGDIHDHVRIDGAPIVVPRFVNIADVLFGRSDESLDLGPDAIAHWER